MAIRLSFYVHGDGTACHHPFSPLGEAEKAYAAECPGRLHDEDNGHGYLPLKMEKFDIHEGKVLSLRERNYYDDSDFYAVVWDDERECLRTVEYDTTRFAGGGTASIDATPETVEAANKWMRGWYFGKLFEAAVAEAEKIQPGAEVEAVRGRKVPVGTRCTVLREWENRFGYSEWTTQHRVLVRRHDTGEEVWSDLHNFAVPGDEVANQVIDQMEHLAIQAANSDPTGSWHLPFTAGMIVV